MFHEVRETFRFLFSTILIIACCKSFAQEYNYINYDTKDGLAGSTVYYMCQDKFGYIWFATDNGVSRFDGKRFKNFTTEDGLPDNEILHLNADTKGRVWMSPFNKSVCYYYKGKIYNSKNDSRLNILFPSYVLFHGLNEKDDFIMHARDGVYAYKNEGKIVQIINFEKVAATYGLKSNKFGIGSHLNYPKNFLLFNNGYVFVYNNDSLKLVKINKLVIGNEYHFWVNHELKWFTWKHPPPGIYNTITHITETVSLYNTMKGSWMIDSIGIMDPKPFLPGKKISMSFKDNEGNLWFTTLGEGVYRLTSTSMKTFHNDHEVFSVEKSKGKIYTGSGNGNLRIIKGTVLEKDIFFKELTNPIANSNRLYTILASQSGVLYLGYDSHLFRLENGKLKVSQLNPIKSIDIIDSANILVATKSYIFKIREHDLEIMDTLLHERGTKVIHQNGTHFIGTLNGLVAIDGNKIITYIGEKNPLLSKRIVDMFKMPGGGIWIATNDNGVLFFKDNKVQTVFNVKSGLNSNLSRSLFINNNTLWVGTNKGINKIDLLTNKVLGGYSVSDGLASDIINDIYVENDTIWICSPKGLTYFDERRIRDSSISILDLNTIIVSGKQQDLQASLNLSHENDNITFEYSGISFKSGGEILYKYKLLGLNKELKETRLNSLSYPSLPPGEYEFQLYAVNKFGKKSNTVIVKFSIAAPFWKTFWFWSVIFLIVFTSSWYLLSKRYKILQKRLDEKTKMAKQISELEHTALRAQMNPHFIFNCLNSIQHFILKKDFEQTNNYISRFSDLIRQTLENSSKPNISLSDEIVYLTNYLELEKMRFSSRFEYDIEVDPFISADELYIPSMLIQPVFENSIRHGIRYKPDGTGIIKMKVTSSDDHIIFDIEDNGIGREKSAAYKSKQHIEYQSRGISLIKKRLEVLNIGHHEHSMVQITDLKDNNDQPSGTRVIISFPLSIINKLNSNDQGSFN